MTNWIVPSSRKMSYLDELLRETGHAQWRREGADIQAGDIVYFYISSPIMAIHWKCRVNDVYTTSKFEDAKYFPENESWPAGEQGDYFQVETLCEYAIGNLLDYSELKKHGQHSRLMGKERVNPELQAYLDYVDTLQSSPEKVKHAVSILDDKTLKKKAMEYSQQQVKQTTQNTHRFVRNPYVSEYAKRLAEGKCDLCGNSAPFNDKDGRPYLETHHVVWLSRGGADSIENVVALCPNCHRKMHICDDKNDVSKLMLICAKHSIN